MDRGAACRRLAGTARSSARAVVVRARAIWLHWIKAVWPRRSTSMFNRLSLASLLVPALVLAVALLPACVNNGGDDDPNMQPQPGQCSSLAGTWEVDGACGGDLCTITQSGCAITALTC